MIFGLAKISETPFATRQTKAHAHTRPAYGEEIFSSNKN